MTERVSATEMDRTSHSLWFYEVLEDEYRALHGPLPARYLRSKEEILRRARGRKEINELLVEKLYLEIHDPANLKSGRSALCLSGGGIRSGTFSLGIIQGLARYGLLDKFDYLSTVSGGGYIGSWLTGWIHRHRHGIRGVVEELRNDDPATKKVLDPEPNPLRQLRNYSSFITPRVGLLTVDTWTFLAIILRNLLLNWSVLIPLLLAALALPRVYISLVNELPPRWIQYAFLALGFVLGVIAITYISMNRPSISDSTEDTGRRASGDAGRGGLRARWREAVARVKALENPTAREKMYIYLQFFKDQDSFLKLCWAMLILSGILLSTYWAWFRSSNFNLDTQTFDLASGGDAVPARTALFLGFLVFGISFYLLGWLIYVVVLRHYSTSGLLMTLITGIGGGVLLWATATSVPFFLHPVGYHEADHFWNSALYVCFSMPLFLALFLLANTLFIAITSRGQQIKDEDREWLSRCSAWFLIAAGAWMIFSALVIFGPPLLYQFFQLAAPAGLAATILTAMLGRSASTPSRQGDSGTSSKGWTAFLLKYALKIAAPLTLVFLVIVLSFLTDWLVEASVTLARWITDTTGGLFGLYGGWPFAPLSSQRLSDFFNNEVGFQVLGDRYAHLELLRHTPLWLSGGLMLALLLFGLFVARFVLNLNKFSLHGGYRNRLVRAFLGSSRTEDERRPNPFTGFDPADNVQMHELRPGLLSVDSIVGDETGADATTSFVNKLRLAAQKAHVDEDEDEEAEEAKKAEEMSPGGAAEDIYDYLYRHVSDDTRELLKEHFAQNAAAPTQTLLSELIRDFNLILETEEFYRLFGEASDVRAEPAAKDSGQEHGPHGNQLIIVNRLILEQAFPGEIKPYDFPPPPHRLMHVVNVTLNLVGGKNLAWQQRRAESFTVSPLHSGSFRVGYRESSAYGGEYDGISLGTAATISGAAANPNMGYYSSSAIVTFIMTLFNVRLGWWLGNPGPAGEDTYRYSYPKLAIQPILSEAFGMTDDTSPYVNLSDGGHFENLGLYEMVLRRCKFVVVVDGSQDPDCGFNDLGNAVRKIRIDLGVPIEFRGEIDIFPRNRTPQNRTGRYCAVADINYKWVDGADASNGVLIYFKPAFYGDEPRDVFNYAKQFREFPHQSTADQFFNEPQFESYRMLGLYIVQGIIEGFGKRLHVPVTQAGAVTTPAPGAPAFIAAPSIALPVNTGRINLTLREFEEKVKKYLGL